MTTPSDVWASGAAYEPFVGRWSRLVARQFLAWLGLAREQRWLDVGCGTGILTRTILEQAHPAAVVGLDPSAGFLAFARTQTADTRASFEAGDARTVPFAPDTFDVTVAGLALNFVPDPARGVAEMARVTRRGGTVGVYVWDYAGEMQMLRSFWDAAVAIDPSALDLDEGRRFPICRPERLRELFEVELNAVDATAINVPTDFRDFDDFWTPFLGGQGPASSYVAALDEDRRSALRARLRATLPTAPDGSIHLTARAWALRGERQ
jgi:SAM-dependent methyltransferase